ncbi:MAG: hypothetical protein JSS94_08555 [Bacteroidetes bacterium]|nr:hypothetical protein [Bacteroidota bacterium]
MFLLLSFGANAQSFLIDFPAFSAAPTQNPRELTVAGAASELQVQLDVVAASSSGADVTIKLPTGVEYVTGSVTKISGTSSLTITENGGTANSPVFKIGPNSLALGDRIIFTIKRVANCDARTAAIGGMTFTDKVTGAIAGATTSSATSPTYSMKYAVFSFSQPSPQSNAVLGTNYTRTFTISNGGNGCATQAYFSVNYPSNGITPIKFEVISQNGTTLSTPITLNQTSASGTTYYYTIPSTALPGGDLCQAENIVIRETYKINICNTTTTYNAGWGTASSPANWCQTVTGSATVSMATGVANLTAATGARVGFVNSCTPWTGRYTFTNGGTGNASAAGMYNVKFRWGGSNNGTTLTVSGINRNFLQFTSGTIGSQTGLTVVNGTVSNAIASIDVKDLFTSDPDGVGVGLDDLDGDGFYDDLPAGKTVNIDIATKVNCNSFTCPQNWSNTYDSGVDMQYTSMCDASTMLTSSMKTVATNYTQQTMGLAEKSYAPSNIFGGTPFRARFSVGYYALANPFDTTNTRYLYEITLPAGVSVSGTGNIKWRAGQYPDNASSAGTSLTYTQNGNILTITPTSQNMGWIEIDLVYNCGVSGPVNIPYTLRRIDDIVNNCICNDKVFCGNLSIANAMCPAPCSNGGPSIINFKIERADNSLGWTDNTLSTRQSRSAISSYDLSKALYLDEIDVTASATYGNITATDGLYLYFGINKLVGTDDKLTPKSIDVVVKRNGTVYYTKNITTYLTTGTTTTKQVIRWNLSDLLTSGIQEGDVIETVSHYTVSSNNFPNHDIQTGERLYFYNTTSGTENSCNSLVPEMYLVTPQWIDGQNNPTFSSCSPGSFGGGTHFIGYRFDAAGTKFLYETRPGLLATKFTFTIPTGYDLTSVTWVGYDAAFASTSLTPVLVSGSTYSVDLPAKTSNITVTNNYAFTIYVNVVPNCAAPASTTYTGTIAYIPYYYHYKELPNPPTTTATKNLNVSYATNTKPAISITNLSGNIQAIKPTESFTVRLASTGTSAAPYVWLAIPNTTGVNVSQVIDLATNTVLTPISYSGGQWFKISASGLASGATKDYRIDFTYTSCTATTFPVWAGWNCSDYPTDPSTYTCGKQIGNLTFNPQLSTIQLSKISEPASPVSELCNPLDYTYRFISAGAGNTIQDKLSVKLPTGMSLVSNSVSVEYPLASGNWFPVSTSVSGNVVLLDLMTHPQFPTDGLPGTLTDGGNSDKRMMDIKFQLKTDCNYVSGSNLLLTIYGKNTCQSDSTGNGTTISSSTLSLAGGNASFLVADWAIVATTADNCTSTTKISVTEKIVTSTQTSANGQTRITLPIGFNFANTLNLVSNPNYPVTLIGYGTDAVTGEKYADFTIPAGMTTGQQIDYSFDIAQSTVSCGNYTINLLAREKMGNYPCASAPGGTCTDIYAQVGNKDFTFNVEKPTYSIDVLSGGLSGGTFAGSVKISNTSVYNSTNPISITFYCADAAGNPTSTVFGTATIATPVAAGANATYTYSFTPAATCNSGKVYAVIKTTSNCVCADSNGYVLQLLCYKPAATTGGTAMDANHGITALGRAGTNNDNWPMARKGAWTVLESKEKGFVVNRVPTTAALANITNPVIGMTVYDIEAKCLKIYSVKEGDTNPNWHCFNTQTCPD